MIEMHSKKETFKEREREIHTDRHTYRQIQRDRQTVTHRERDRQRLRETYREEYADAHPDASMQRELIQLQASARTKRKCEQNGQTYIHVYASTLLQKDKRQTGKTDRHYNAKKRKNRQKGDVNTIVDEERHTYRQRNRQTVGQGNNKIKDTDK